MHGIALLETPPGLIRVEVVNPASVLQSRTDKLEVIVENLGPAVREFHKQPVVILLAQLLGQLCCGVCAETVLHCMRDGECRTLLIGHKARLICIWHITLLHKLAHIHLSCALYTATPFKIVLTCRLVHLFNVIVADSAIVCTRKGYADHIGPDSGDILAAGYSVTQPSCILIYQKLAGAPVIVIFRVGECPERGEVPVAAPDCICIVMIVNRLSVLSKRNVSYCTVILRIGSVHIACKPAAEKAMVKTRIELDSACLAAPAYLDAAELLGPFCSSEPAGLVEIKFLSLSKIIEFRIIHGSIGEAQLHLDLLTLLRIVVKHQHGTGTGNRIARPDFRAIVLEASGRHRLLAEFSIEIHADCCSGLILLDIFRFCHDIA